jgi:hypothetical protein
MAAAADANQQPFAGRRLVELQPSTDVLKHTLSSCCIVPGTSKIMDIELVIGDTVPDKGVSYVALAGPLMACAGRLVASSSHAAAVLPVELARPFPLNPAARR